jgi:hypothetical protein
MRPYFWILVAFAVVACGRGPEEAAVTDDSIKESVDEFQNRQIHRRLDPSILASIPDDKVELAVIDYVHAKLRGRYEDEAKVLATLPAGIRALYVTWGVEAEVNNGGFNQYYWNSAGQFANDAVAAFEFFSAHKHAQLMQEANGLRTAEKTEIDKFKEEATIEAFSESYEVSKLGPLDDRFYKLNENLSELRIAKIRSEPALFSGD